MNKNNMSPKNVVTALARKNGESCMMDPNSCSIADLLIGRIRAAHPSITSYVTSGLSSVCCGCGAAISYGKGNTQMVTFGLTNYVLRQVKASIRRANRKRKVIAPEDAEELAKTILKWAAPRPNKGLVRDSHL